MPVYNFKQMEVVPTSKDFIDIVLSKTQRQTPTVVHNGWAIARIRQFYMRKVKYTAQSWRDKLTRILDDFPKVDDIHPFYADLLNVLYDRDHYKLALGQLNTARNLVDKVAQDYVRLLKYGDSLYRCKQLKRAALGRMCTLMKKHGPSLSYLEQVRQHMSRLPAVDPNTRTLLLTGFPNVGKSSFMNKVTRAEVDVQPYAFTTKSLFVGHMDYKYLRWQVIDTPGLLDRPLEERNTIEMQSITALAHLRAAVLYIVDISEQCGYSIAQQAALFDSVKPLFANKPLMIVANKTDVVPLDSLKAEDLAIIDAMVAEALRVSNGGVVDPSEKGELLTMSTLTEDNVMDVRNIACDRLLALRVEQKVHGKRINDVMNRIHVAQPRGGVDAAARPPCIPAGLEQARAKKGVAGEKKKKTEKDLQEENGGAGVYNADMRKRYQLEDDSWKYDIVPEIFNGHNVADFVDPDIDARLEALEREEDALAAAHQEQFGDAMEDEHLTPEEAELLAEIRSRRGKLITDHRRKKSVGNNAPVMPRTADASHRRDTRGMKASLERMGIDAGPAVERARGRSQTRKRTRSEAGRQDMEVEGGEAGQTQEKKRLHSSKSRSMSRGRALSTADAKEGRGLKDAAQKNKAVKMADRAQRRMGKLAKAGEADRVIQSKMPKHLFSGKRGKGKTDRR